MFVEPAPVRAVLLAEFAVGSVGVHEDGVTLAGRPLDGLRRGRCDPHRRMRLLQGLRQDLDVPQAVEPAVIVEALVAPRPQHDIHVLAKAGVRLFPRDAEHLELLRVKAPARAPVHAPARQHVEQGHLFRQPGGMVERGEGDPGPDAQVLRDAGDVHAHQVHRRTDAVGREVMLRQPDRVVARTVHDADPVECPLVYGRKGDAPLLPTEELEDAELQAPPSPPDASGVWSGVRSSYSGSSPRDCASKYFAISPS